MSEQQAQAFEEWMLANHASPRGGTYQSGFKITDLRAAWTARGQADAAIARTWQPIETAPKDGTWIIGWGRIANGTPMKDPFMMHWHTAYFHWTDNHMVYLPTHWQPLPAPPQ